MGNLIYVDFDIWVLLYFSLVLVSVVVDDGD